MLEYDLHLERGIRRKQLQIPPPRIMDFPKSASYVEVLEQAKGVFFSDEEDDMRLYSLAGA